MEHWVISNVDFGFFFCFFFWELEFHELKYSSIWIFSRNSSNSHGTWVHGTRVPEIYIYFLIFQFAITWFFKNRVLNWNSIFRKSSFETWAFPYLVSDMGHFAEKFWWKRQMPIFSKGQNIKTMKWKKLNCPPLYNVKAHFFDY